MPHANLDADILQYIIEHQVRPGERLPTIAELSAELGVSISKIREELEVARTLGLVQIKPRTGTLVQDFDFAPAVTLSVLYAIGLNRAHFHDFSKLRNSVELAFWVEAVEQLTPEDIASLRHLVSCAYEKLNHVPIEVPFEDHRDLHLTFFKHLENPFVQGVLRAYWAAYKAFGLALYAELAYHRKVWMYHERMVEHVARGEFEAGRQALEEHMTLLRYRSGVDEEAADRPVKESSPIYHFFE
jgi:DNA-binding FadR family transcriptional regulator